MHFVWFDYIVNLALGPSHLPVLVGLTEDACQTMVHTWHLIHLIEVKLRLSLCTQDIKHREWALTRKLEKGHGDYAAAKFDIEFSFSVRLSKPDPADSALRPVLGESDLLPVGQQGAVVPAPATCQGVAGLATVLERAFCGEVLQDAEVHDCSLG